MEERKVKAHIQEDTITEYAMYPEHTKRSESEIFRHSKDKLKKDGHYKCFICGCKEKLESHHLFEWAFAESLDLNKIKESLIIFDFYGYSRAMKDVPFQSIDDIRNHLVLCENHHRHNLCGLHHLAFPLWLSQVATKEGMETVPQSEEDLKQREIFYNFKEKS